MSALRLSSPTTELRSGSELTVATVARLIASGSASSKAELATLTGVSRTSITGAVDRLLRAGVIRLQGTTPRSGRGRPADALSISPDAGAILIFDCGAKSTRMAIADLGQRILAERAIPLDVEIGPTATLAILIEQMHGLLDEIPIDPPHRCVVIGLPARLDYQAGIPVRPPVMPGWDGFRVGEPLRAEFGCHVIMENDANLRALGEARTLAPDQSPLLAIKVGTGIGAGLVTSDGSLHRGSDGAAGEMGHLTLRSAPAVTCACGNTACLEAVASVPALIRRYGEEADGDVPIDAAKLTDLIAAGDALAASIVRESARYLGEAIADVVNMLNPARVVLHGPTTSASDDLLALVRAMVYEHARPLATRHLQVALSVLGERAGVAGAMVLGLEHLLSPASISEIVHSRPRSSTQAPRNV